MCHCQKPSCNWSDCCCGERCFGYCCCCCILCWFKFFYKRQHYHRGVDTDHSSCSQKCLEGLSKPFTYRIEYPRKLFEWTKAHSHTLRTITMNQYNFSQDLVNLLMSFAFTDTIWDTTSPTDYPMYIIKNLLGEKLCSKCISDRIANCQHPGTSSNSDNCMRIVLFGSGAVGKTCIVNRLKDDIWVDEYDPTIEDYWNITTTIDGLKVNLELVDTAGQDEFSALRDHYVRTCNLFLICVSCTDKNSLKEINKFYDPIVYTHEDYGMKWHDHPISCVIVMTKCDSDSEEKKITLQDCIQRANEVGLNNVPIVQTSAKENKNIQLAIEILIKTSWLKHRFPNTKTVCEEQKSNMST